MLFDSLDIYNEGYIAFDQLFALYKVRIFNRLIEVYRKHVLKSSAFYHNTIIFIPVIFDQLHLLQQQTFDAEKCVRHWVVYS